MNQQVQIPKDVLIGFKLLLDELQEGSDGFIIEKLVERLKTPVNDKFEAIERRDNFTKYKKADIGSSEREEYRQKYLDQMGIPEDFRSKKENTLL